MPRALLLVEPDESLRSQLLLLAEEAGWNPISCDSFASARHMLMTLRPEMVVSNVRLAAFNGIQLAYLAKLADPTTSIVVYASDNDLGLATDAQEACAFFERERFIPYSLPAYLAAAAQLPPRDRRDPRRPDRRATFRGGRRATDLSFLHPSGIQPPLGPDPPTKRV